MAVVNSARFLLFVIFISGFCYLLTAGGVEFRRGREGKRRDDYITMMTEAIITIFRSEH